MDAQLRDFADAMHDSGNVEQDDAAIEGGSPNALDAAASSDAHVAGDSAQDAGDAGALNDCTCVTAGSWHLANVSPCVLRGDKPWMFSASLTDGGLLDCGTSVIEPPSPPSSEWTTSAIELSCTGDFEVCWVIRAGSYLDPKPTDCVIARVCTSFSYPTASLRMTLPELPGWVSDEHACIEAFAEGGYGQATLQGSSDSCGRIETTAGNPVVFDITNYCKVSCQMTPEAPECSNCQPGIGD